MNNPKKIAFIVGTLSRGGAERQLFYMLRTLRNNRKYEIVLLCLTKGEYWENKIRSLGVNVIWVGKYNNRILRLLFIIKSLRSYSPDIIQSQHFYTNIYASIASYFFQAISVGAIRNDLYSEIASNGKFLGYWSYAFPKVLVVNSLNSMNNALKLKIKKGKLRYLPNVVDTEVYIPGNKAQKREILILSIARLHPQKNLKLLIDIAKKLDKEIDTPLRFLILGEGPLKNELDAYIKTKSFSIDFIELGGAVGNPEYFYGQADIFLLTSRYEGTPNVILEAMSSGLPVVSTKVGEMPNIIEDNITGLLSDNGDFDSIYLNTKKLVLDYELRIKIGLNAKDYIHRNYSYHGFNERLEELYLGIESFSK